MVGGLLVGGINSVYHTGDLSPFGPPVAVREKVAFLSRQQRGGVDALFRPFIYRPSPLI